MFGVQAARTSWDVLVLVRTDDPLPRERNPEQDLIADFLVIFALSSRTCRLL